MAQKASAPRATRRARKPRALDPGRAACGRLDMHFRAPGEIAHISDPIWQDISCVAAVGRTLFCSCDETASVERLLIDPETGHAGEHESFALGDAFDLPGGRTGEMDIEGLSVADGYLWVTGSHALKRDKPDEGLDDLRGLGWDENRAFLGRVPLLDRGDGVFEPVAAIDAMDGAPARDARMLRMHDDPEDSPIRRMLAEDALLGPFMGLPCKENGFDIEGLAVRGSTVLLGLRGPVIGGLAFLLRLELKEKGRRRLKPRKLDNGRRYALHAIDLGGQGIRDLAWGGERLLILSGATTDIEARQSVVALDLVDPAREIFGTDAVTSVLDLPFLHGADHAEGIDLVPVGGADRLLVAYDSPHPDRTDRLLVAYDSPHPDRTDPEKDRLTADLFEMPPAG